MDDKTSQLLSQLLQGLAYHNKDSEMFLGGSHAKGTADEVSDIDLWLSAEQVDPSTIGSLLISGRVMPLGAVSLFHGLAKDGTVLDIVIGPKPWDGYVRLEPGEPLDLSGPKPEHDFIADFWISSYKHRKPLFRGLDAMVCFGLHHDRMGLLRMWAQHDRGEDPGDSIFTISGMTPFIRDCLTPHRRNLLGLPCRTDRELFGAIDAYREEALALFPERNALADIVINDPVWKSLAAKSHG